MGYFANLAVSWLAMEELRLAVNYILWGNVILLRATEFKWNLSWSTSTMTWSVDKLRRTPAFERRALVKSANWLNSLFVKMKLTKTELIIYYLLSCCALHGLSNGQENAENTAENNAHSTPIEDTAQFHKQNQERRRVECDFFLKSH